MYKSKIMKYLAGIIGAVVLGGILISATLYQSEETTPTTTENPVKIEEKKVQWMSFEEAIKKSEKEPRKIFIDIYTDWCGWCKRMDKTTFENETIAQLLNEKYYAVKLDAEQKDSIQFQGHTFKFVAQGRNGYHELAAALLNGKMSYPTVVFMNEKLELITPVPGYQQPKDLHPLLKFFGESSKYGEEDWKAFLENYKSPFEGE